MIRAECGDTCGVKLYVRGAVIRAGCGDTCGVR